jgi:hypothetical protein
MTRRLRIWVAAFVVLMLAGCAHRLPNGSGWASELAMRPGSSLPQEGASQQQTITLFEISQQRRVGRKFFIAGMGYVAFNGGGTTLAGANRALDPFVEVTIVDGRGPTLTACRTLLTPDSLKDRAVRIGGTGYFVALPGVHQRQLAVIRLEEISRCELVDRR